MTIESRVNSFPSPIDRFRDELVGYFPVYSKSEEKPFDEEIFEFMNSGEFPPALAEHVARWSRAAQQHELAFGTDFIPNRFLLPISMRKLGYLDYFNAYFGIVDGQAKLLNFLSKKQKKDNAVLSVEKDRRDLYVANIGIKVDFPISNQFLSQLKSTLLGHKTTVPLARLDVHFDTFNKAIYLFEAAPYEVGLPGNFQDFSLKRFAHFLDLPLDALKIPNTINPDNNRVNYFIRQKIQEYIGSSKEDFLKFSFEVSMQVANGIFGEQWNQMYVCHPSSAIKLRDGFTLTSDVTPPQKKVQTLQRALEGKFGEVEQLVDQAKDVSWFSVSNK